MKSFTKFLDEGTSLHKLAVHVSPVDSSYKNFTVKAVGSEVQHVKIGDKLKSSDLDDLADAGHKVKEIKNESN